MQMGDIFSLLVRTVHFAFFLSSRINKVENFHSIMYPNGPRNSRRR
uniref:Uncharacterized protein n=1 Tax=Rhizophora mucronata TaxID=61149 RepID=A0A2P2KH91_RHIMU